MAKIAAAGLGGSTRYAIGDVVPGMYLVNWDHAPVLELIIDVTLLRSLGMEASEISKNSIPILTGSPFEALKKRCLFPWMTHHHNLRSITTTNE